MSAWSRSLWREGLARVGNRLTARRLSRQLATRSPVPTGGVAVFFATTPFNLYQFEQWRRPLERLAEQAGVFVIVDRADTGRLIVDQTSLPVVLAQGSSSLERLVAERDVRVVFYLNQVEANFRMLRFAEPVHVQIGHGESDKGGSVSNQHKAYDLTFVGGEAGRRRLQRALRGFDGESRTRLVGRPQLDHDYPGAPDWAPDSGRRVWYAPTWEGDRPTIAYGSLVSHGLMIIDALLADPSIRIIYRPHPRTSTADPAHAAADRAIRRRLEAAGDRHLVDAGPYGWQWRFADACITDISAAAYDWLATEKPLVITEPVETRAYRPESPLLDQSRLLPAGEADQVVRWLDEARPAPGLIEHYFGDVADGASSERFEATTLELLSRTNG